MFDIKMGDVFKLPMICEDGDGFVYSKDLRHSIKFDDSDVHMMSHKLAVAHAINNHDRLTEENKQLREFVKMIANGRTNDPESAVIHLKIHSNTAKEILNK